MFEIRLVLLKDALEEPKVDFFSIVSRTDVVKNLDYILRTLQNVLIEDRKSQISL